MEKRYTLRDFGKLLLHWFVTVLGTGVAFAIAYAGLWDTGEYTGDPLGSSIYAVRTPLFIAGAAIIVVGYIFVWKIWLKKDLLRCAEVHWEWVALYVVVALWNLVLVFALGLVVMMFRMPSLFSAIAPPAEMLPLIVVGYMILLPAVESLIAGLMKRLR